MPFLSDPLAVLAVVSIGIALVLYAFWPAYGWRFIPHPSEPKTESFKLAPPKPKSPGDIF